ncbi:hypothetical protein Hanom_Chr09g00855311 [Helianthus anomalus]
MVTSKCSFCQRQHAFSTCAAYGAWMEAYGMCPWPLVRRVKNVWDKIRIWLTGNFPEVLPTLCKGASEVELNELEKSLITSVHVGTKNLLSTSRWHQESFIKRRNDAMCTKWIDNFGA